MWRVTFSSHKLLRSEILRQAQDDKFFGGGPYDLSLRLASLGTFAHGLRPISLKRPHCDLFRALDPRQEEVMHTNGYLPLSGEWGYTFASQAHA